MNVCFYIKSQGGYIRAKDLKDNRPMYDQLLSEVAKGYVLLLRKNARSRFLPIPLSRFIIGLRLLLSLG